MSTLGLPTGRAGRILESPDSSCWDMQAVTNWDLCHSSHMAGESGAKRKVLQNADVKVDVQFDKVKRYQEQGLLQSGRTCRTQSEGCIGR